MIRRILAKLRRRKAKPVQPLGRFFAHSVAEFNNGTKRYFHDSARFATRPSRRAGGTSDGPRTGAVT